MCWAVDWIPERRKRTNALSPAVCLYVQHFLYKIGRRVHVVHTLQSLHALPGKNYRKRFVYSRSSSSFFGSSFQLTSATVRHGAICVSCRSLACVYTKSFSIIHQKKEAKEEENEQEEEHQKFKIVTVAAFKWKYIKLNWWGRQAGRALLHLLSWHFIR